MAVFGGNYMKYVNEAFVVICRPSESYERQACAVLQVT